MKTIITLFLMFSISYAPAQEVKKKAAETKRKAGERTEERADQRLEQGIDQGLNAVEGLFKKKNRNQTPRTEPKAGGLRALMGSQKAAPDLPEAYHFSSQMDVMLTSTNKRGRQEQTPMRYHLQAQGEQMGLSMDYSQENTRGQGFAIFDMKNRSMLVLSQSGSQRVAMAIPIDEESLAAYQSKDEDADGELSFTKSGKTKQILGYTCQEYRFTGPEYSGSSWISDALPQYRQNFMLLAQQAKQGNKQNLPTGFPQGTMLEMHMTTEKGEQTHWLVTALKDEAPLSISLADYQLISMPAGAER